MKNKSDLNPQFRLPKLRFPEFRDAPEWDEKRLGEIFDYHTTANNSRADLSDSGDTYYIHYGDIHTKFHTYVDFSKDIIPKINSGLYKNATLLTNGDLILADTSEDTEGLAKSIEVRGINHGIKAISGLHTILLREKQNEYVNGFKGLLREIDTVSKQIQKFAVGIKVYAISKAVLMQILLPLPSHNEQQKITDCLSTLGDLISSHTKKLETLKKHKKGLMSQLFPADGKTVPRLRFPEFRDTQEWEEKRLGNVGEIITGNTPSTANSYYYRGNKLFVSPGDMTNTRYITSTKTTLSEEGFKETRHVRANSILFVCIGSTIGKIAQNKYECATNQQINSVSPFSEYSNDFIYSALEYYANNIALIAGIQAVPIINKTAFSNVKIKFPCLPEQQKIANCLSSLDKLISAQTQKLEILKKHKKGLIQQLFPAAEEAGE